MPSPLKWSGSAHILKDDGTFTERQKIGEDQDLWGGRTQEFEICLILVLLACGYLSGNNIR